VKIFSMVKFHQGVRMEMACGKRAMEYLNRVYQQSKTVSQTFSAPVLEIGDAAKKVSDQLEQQKSRIASLEQQVFADIAKSYVNREGVLHFEGGLSSGGVRDLADRIADQCGGTAAVFSGNDDSGYSYCLVSRKEDLRQLGKEMTARLQGRGGGKPGFQQGSVRVTRGQIEAFFAEQSSFFV
jgi:alanyl-tRNA synthetase